MKNLTIFLIILTAAIISIPVMGQSPWILQRASGVPTAIDPPMIFFSVNEEVCWGININNSQYLRTTNGGVNWTTGQITSDELSCTSIAALDANTAWAAMKNSNQGGIFKTTDGGLSWTKHPDAFAGTGGAPNSIHFYDALNGVCVGNPRGNPFIWEIYTTNDGGTIWNRVPAANIPPQLSVEIVLRRVGVAAGGSFWFNTDYGSLYRTTDMGMSWTVIRDVMGDQDAFGFSFKDNLNGLACTFVTSNKISRTTDGGVTWTRITLQAPGLAGISPFLINYAKGTEGSYVITSHYNAGGINASPGSAYSTDDGANWHVVDYLPRGAISFASGSVGWSGGINDSVYKWDSQLLITPTSINDDGFTPETFSLEQNYPNPFNPSTTIRFSLPSPELVTLIIYNLMGEEVTTLINENKPAGVYEVNFSGAGLSSGMYLYTLRAANFTQTKKLILMK